MIRAVCTDGTAFDGVPITIDYADETDSGEDEIAIEMKNGSILYTETELHKDMPKTFSEHLVFQRKKYHLSSNKSFLTERS